MDTKSTEFYLWSLFVGTPCPLFCFVLFSADPDVRFLLKSRTINLLMIQEFKTVFLFFLGLWTGFCTTLIVD